MPSSTATDQNTMPSGEEIYDSIMAQIEPELTTAQLPLLKEKYKSETPEQAKARAERYQKAFKTYDSIYQEFVIEVDTKAHEYRKSALQSAEREESAKEAASLSGLEAAFSSM